MQCACTILSSVACPALQYFSTLSQEWHDFWKKVIEHKMRVLISSTNSVLNISYSGKNWERVHQKSLEVFILSTWFSCPVLMKLEFSRQFFKKYSVQWEQSYFPCGQTDRWTDMTKLIVTFSNFVNTPKNRKKETWTQTDQTTHTKHKNPEYIYSKFLTSLTPSVEKIANIHGFK